ncbi:MAG: hypothetical protein K5894_10745 [Lachnospiraceae bacterium]|nr:hypothetical protein [Lachnospiraceae bacterium]
MEIKEIFHYRTITKNKYIYGIEGESVDFAIRLLKNGIEFSGFICENAKDISINASCRPSIFNKDVYSLDEFEDLKEAVIISSDLQKKRVMERLTIEGLENNYEEIEIIDDYLAEHITSDDSRKGVIIVGTGGTTKQLLKSLEKYSYGFNVFCFCVTDKEAGEDEFHSRKVIGVGDLELYPDNPVLISSIYNISIYKQLILHGVDDKRIYEWVYGLFPGYDFDDDRKNWPMISYRAMYSIVRDIRNKTAIVYGYEKTANALSRILYMLGIEVGAVCLRSSVNEDGRAYDLMSVKNQNCVVLIADLPSVAQKKILDDCGFLETDYICVHNYWSYWGYSHYSDYKNPLDASIGRITVGIDDRKDREIKFIKDNEKTLKIITLGGSTTAPVGVRNRSWNYFLSDILRKNDIQHIIHSLAEPDCNVSCEMMRLIRDGIWEKPDLVISYSGVNNMNLIQEHPFYSSYSELFFKSIDKNVNLGERPKVSRFEYWLTYEKLMQAVCKSEGIRFYAFLQPCLSGKKKNCKNDADIGIEWGYLWDSEKSAYKFVTESDSECRRVYREYCREAPVFRNSAGNIRLEWMFDYSDIFDDEEDVYIDFCHVNEKGNEVIARNIYQDLKNKNVWT